MFNRLKKRIVAMGLVVTTLTGSIGFTSVAKTVAIPRSYETHVVLTNQRLSINKNEVNVDDYFVEWNGDVDGMWWSKQLGDYYRDIREFDGSGDLYIEPHENLDDSMVGDVYKATIYTQGTETKKDDVLQIDYFEGYILPTYLKEVD